MNVCSNWQIKTEGTHDFWKVLSLFKDLGSTLKKKKNLDLLTDFWS